MICNHFTCQNLIWMTHQVFEDRKKSCCQFYPLLCPLNGMHSRIKLQVRGTEHCVFPRCHSTQERTHTCKEFGKCKRLHQIIISSTIQTSHSIFYRIASS